MTDESKRAVAWRCRSWGADDWAYFDGDDKPETVPAAQLEPLYASQPASPAPEAMTRDAFIAGYIARSKITIEMFNQYRVALPCDCGDSLCNGWAAVRRNGPEVLEHVGLFIEAPEPATVEQAIAALVTALAASKGWMRDYADSVVRDAIDRKIKP